MKNYLQESELKQILTARRHENLATTIGLIFTGVMLTLTLVMFAVAFINGVDVVIR